MPRSCASSSQGETFASWSSAVTTISSPSRSVRANARLRRKFSAVMLWPKAVSPGEQPRNAAALSCASVDELGRAPARLVRRADVRVVLAQVARDRVDDLVRALRSARPVEEREPAVECGEPRAHGRDVERGGAHRDLLAVDDPAMSRRRRQRVRDEAAVLGPVRAARAGRGLGCRGDVDLERRLDLDERVEPVASRFVTMPCALPDADRVEAGAPRGVVQARERAAHEPGEHEVLGPPLALRAAERSRRARCARRPHDRP